MILCFGGLFGFVRETRKKLSSPKPGRKNVLSDFDMNESCGIQKLSEEQTN